MRFRDSTSAGIFPRHCGYPLMVLVLSFHVLQCVQMIDFNIYIWVQSYLLSTHNRLCYIYYLFLPIVFVVYACLLLGQVSTDELSKTVHGNLWVTICVSCMWTGRVMRSCQSIPELEGFLGLTPPNCQHTFDLWFLSLNFWGPNSNLRHVIKNPISFDSGILLAKNATPWF